MIPIENVVKPECLDDRFGMLQLGAYRKPVRHRSVLQLVGGADRNLIQFTPSGFGLTIIARHFITEELASGKLVEVPLVPPIPERHVGIATLKGVLLSAASKHFIQSLP